MSKVSQIVMLVFLVALGCSSNAGQTVAEQSEISPEIDSVDAAVNNPTDSSSTAVKNESVFEPKLVQLSETRYLREMITEELERAYSEGGEYIDPRRVMQLLENEQGLNNSESGDQTQQEAPKTWRISQLIHNEAKSLFEKGNISAAAEKWKNLATDERAFTISIEVDCNPTMLQTNYALIGSLEMPIFVLAENIKGRDCFRLCAGVFATKELAEEAITDIKDRIKTSFPFVHNLVRRTS